MKVEVGVMNQEIDYHINAILKRDEIIYRQKISQCKSLIEELFCLYFMVAAKETGFADSAFCLIFPQQEIKVLEKSYRVDFLIETQIKGNIYRLIVECDDYEQTERKTKEKEKAIKSLGYSMIRFTSSKVYNNPFDCAMEAIEFMEEMAKKRG